MATSKPYGQAVKSLLNKEADLDSDALKAMLLTSAYTPNLDTHRYKSDLTNEVVGTGYTAGGVTLTSVTVVYTAANSWGTARANSTAYAVGDIVRPSTGNGFLYRAVVAGTSAASPPTYPTVLGQTVTDGGVTWVAFGTGVTVVDAADPAWPASTITARYMVIYDSTPATDATRPLLVLVDFVTDVSSTSGTLTGVFPATGFLVLGS